MKAINQGNTFTIHNNTLKTFDALPAQSYYLRFNKNSGFFLEVAAPIEIKENKVYGEHDVKCNKVLNSFKRFNRNLGVILSGDKGIGKSLFVKILADKVIDEGYPMIIIDRYIPGIASYIESIEQECMIVFDEFDKTFGEINAPDGQSTPQTEMLTLFDGLASGKKLFVITCNQLYRLSDFLVNRPGRFHYHFRFNYPTAEEIKEYLEDNIQKEMYGEIKEVVKFSRRVKLNYDCLRAIAFELSSGLSFKNAINDLNIINISREQYKITLVYENGFTAVKKSISLDLFNEDEECDCWLSNGKGCDFVSVSFNPNDAVWDENLLSNVIDIDKVSISYYQYDESDKTEKALINEATRSKPVRLTIDRVSEDNLRYTV